MLEVRGLEVHYGGIAAVKGIDFEVREGELVCLIGANGAGKTTTLKAIAAVVPACGGDIRLLPAAPTRTVDVERLRADPHRLEAVRHVSARVACPPPGARIGAQPGGTS